jgi:hypothetical protein
MVKKNYGRYCITGLGVVASGAALYSVFFRGQGLLNV